VLENLKNRAEELVRQHVPEELSRSLLKVPAGPCAAPRPARPHAAGASPRCAARRASAWPVELRPTILPPPHPQGRTSGFPGAGPSFGAGRPSLGGASALTASSAAVLEDGDPYATTPEPASVSPASSLAAGGAGSELSRRGRLPGSGLSTTSMSAFARATTATRALSAPIEDAHEGTDAEGPAGGGGGGGAHGAAPGGSGGGRRMVLSSLSMPLRGNRRAAAAMEGIPSAAVVEDGEGAGEGVRGPMGGTPGRARRLGDAPPCVSCRRLRSCSRCPPIPCPTPRLATSPPGHGNEWGLTPHQQRVVADLMRLRQLVHKAVSKMDQRWAGPRGCGGLSKRSSWEGRGLTHILPLPPPPPAPTAASRRSCTPPPTATPTRCRACCGRA
jgi:hypothetical protein